jgi:hypothetical protein
MDGRLKALCTYILDTKSIILGFAVFNFNLIWVWDAGITCACVACPWYHTWSYLNEPTILLFAALLLRINRWWSNAVAIVLAGYVIGYAAYVFSIVDDVLGGLRAEWKAIRMFYPYIIGSWDSQYLFALIILCCSAFSLKSNFRHRRVVWHGG